MWADRARLGVVFLVFVGLFIAMGALGVAQTDQIWPVARVALVCGGLGWAASERLISSSAARSAV
jgi:hypothetical protein